MVVKLLREREHQRVLYLSVETPIEPGPSVERLAWDILDLCQRVNIGDGPWVAVCLGDHAGTAFVQCPRSSAEHDLLPPAWRDAATAVAALEVPTVATLAGEVQGPAWDLALACDLRVASSTARVGSPEVRLGRMPAGGATQWLTRAVGPACATRLLLLGETLTGSQAHALGLVQWLEGVGALGPCVEEVLDNLRAGAPIALSYVCEAVRAGMQLPLDHGLRLEADLAVLLQTTSDRPAGIAAYVERRPPPTFEGQ